MARDLEVRSSNPGLGLNFSLEFKSKLNKANFTIMFNTNNKPANEKRCLL